MFSDLAPPTDSLYKFCAIAGTAVVVGFILIPIHLYMHIDEKLAQERLKSAVTKAEEEWLEKRAETLKVPAMEVEEAAKELLEDQRKIAIDKAEISAHAVEYAKLRHYAMFVTGLSAVMALAGVFLASYGFKNWYTKIQRPMDLAPRKGGEGE